MLGRLLPLLMGMGRRRKRGGRKLMIQGSGRRRRKTGMRRRRGTRRMIGRGIFDTIKNIGKKAFNIARSVPIISTGLNLAGKKDWADAAKSVGFGRRKRYRTRYGGRMSIYGGRRRRYRRRTRRGGRKRATKRRFSVFGGRKLMGIIPLARGMGRRRRYRRKRMGGRKRTYRVGLFSRRRR